MIDFETGDPVDFHQFGGNLHLIVVHDVADDGNSLTRVTLTEPYDVVEVLLTSINALRLRAAAAAEQARCGKPHEFHQPEKGHTHNRANLLADRLAVAQESLKAIRRDLGAIVHHDEAWAASQEEAAG